jgi:hypothetical protein
MTTGQWAKGDIPVYPYPARGTSWHGWWLDYALKNEVAFELVLGFARGRVKRPTDEERARDAEFGTAYSHRSLRDAPNRAALELHRTRARGPDATLEPAFVTEERG